MKSLGDILQNKGHPRSHPSTKLLFLNIVLVLVSNHKNEDRKSRSRLKARDRKIEILDLVSKHEIKRQKFSISSRSTRPKDRNSRSRLKAWDWKEEFLDLVSRVEKGISLCSGRCLFHALQVNFEDNDPDLALKFGWFLIRAKVRIDPINGPMSQLS